MLFNVTFTLLVAQSFGRIITTREIHLDERSIEPRRAGVTILAECDFRERVIALTYRQSFLMSAVALRLMMRGKSTASMPLMMTLYVFMGSEPLKGGVPDKNSNINTPRDQ